jgi:YidC/Oxa1 family membrane protein insertase
VGFWDIFKNAIFNIIDWFYRLSGDWGIAIILITIVFRVLILPITIGTTKSSLQMQKLQPRIKELQEKYADDKVRLQEEQLKLYTEAKYNPLSGCLPMLLQMPLFSSLFSVLKELSTRIVEAGHSQSVLPANFYALIPDLSLSAKTVFSFTAEGAIQSIPYIVMLAIFSLSMLIPMLSNPQMDSNGRFTALFMSGMMLVMGWGTPAGVLLYWDVSAIIGQIQTAIIKWFSNRKDLQEESVIEIKPVKVDVERRERKGRPRKSR